MAEKDNSTTSLQKVQIVITILLFVVGIINVRAMAMEQTRAKEREDIKQRLEYCEQRIVPEDKMQQMMQGVVRTELLDFELRWQSKYGFIPKIKRSTQ